MKHNRGTHYQGKSDRQVKFSQDVTYYIGWTLLIGLVIHLITKIWT